MKSQISHRVFQSASLALVLVMGQGQLAQAQDDTAPQMPETCELRAESDIIRIVVCTAPDMGEAEFADAGRVVCGEALPCGAWIWSDPDAAPAEAPDNHDGLTQDQVTSSKGVWVAENEIYISIDQVKGQ